MSVVILANIFIPRKFDTNYDVNITEELFFFKRSGLFIHLLLLKDPGLQSFTILYSSKSISLSRAHNAMCVMLHHCSNPCCIYKCTTTFSWLVLSFAEKMNNTAEDPDFEVSSSVGDRASFVSNTSSRLLRSTCHHLGPCHEGHGIQFNSRISPSPSR